MTRKKARAQLFKGRGRKAEKKKIFPKTSEKLLTKEKKYATMLDGQERINGERH